jgi:hypothetical protein
MALQSPPGNGIEDRGGELRGVGWASQRVPKEAAMLCRTHSGDPDAALNALNRVRLLYDLAPYRAPPRRYQIFSVAVLLATVGILALI